MEENFVSFGFFVICPLGAAGRGCELKKIKRINHVVVDGCGYGFSAGFVITMAFTETFQNVRNGIRVSTVSIVC